MAEFQEVMRQYKRMCRYYPACEECPLYNMYAGCSCSRCIRDYPDEVERIIMDWAAEHAETRYPTWKEWHDPNFPDADEEIFPCMFTECPVEEVCDYNVCRNLPIPADIAEKLGVKPITKEE